MQSVRWATGRRKLLHQLPPKLRDDVRARVSWPAPTRSGCLGGVAISAAEVVAKALASGDATPPLHHVLGFKLDFAPNIEVVAYLLAHLDVGERPQRPHTARSPRLRADARGRDGCICQQLEPRGGRRLGQTMRKLAFGFLCPLVLYFFSAIEASAADAWREDFRRCRVLKQFSEGSVDISANEKMVELDVQWGDGADLDNLGIANISVQIDNVPLPQPQPLRSDTGMLYGFRLGSFDEILPPLSRGKRLQISIPDKPERSVDLDIGVGRKAVAFLKKY